MAIKIGNDWDELAAREEQQPYYKALRAFLAEEYRTRTVYPPKEDIFNALKNCPLSSVKAVILGQDPYMNAGEAHGMSFSVLPGVKIPASLKNIFKELQDDLGIEPPENGCLINWEKQGVLLLNTVLTVRAKTPKSHAGKGWERFTDAVIGAVNGENRPIAFMLWGNDAKKKAELVTNPEHKIFTAAHPSPLAGGRFFGCRHFSGVNRFLEENGVTPIDWRL